MSPTRPSCPSTASAPANRASRRLKALVVPLCRRRRRAPSPLWARTPPARPPRLLLRSRPRARPRPARRRASELIPALSAAPTMIPTTRRNSTTTTRSSTRTRTITRRPLCRRVTPPTTPPPTPRAPCTISQALPTKSRPTLRLVRCNTARTCCRSHRFPRRP